MSSHADTSLIWMAAEITTFVVSSWILSRASSAWSTSKNKEDDDPLVRPPQERQRRRRRSSLDEVHQTLGTGPPAKERVRKLRQASFSKRLSVSYANSDPLMIMKVRTACTYGTCIHKPTCTHGKSRSWMIGGSVHGAFIVVFESIRLMQLLDFASCVLLVRPSLFSFFIVDSLSLSLFLSLALYY